MEKILALWQNNKIDCKGAFPLFPTHIPVSFYLLDRNTEIGTPVTLIELTQVELKTYILYPQEIMGRVLSAYYIWRMFLLDVCHKYTA